VKLGNIVDIRKGKKPMTIVAEPREGYRRLIQIDDLRPNSQPKYCPSAKDEIIAEPSDVIIAWDGANAATSNFGLSGVVGSTLAILRPRIKGIITPYLGQFLRAKTAYLRSKCKGATVPHIDGRMLENLEVPLLPLAEQRRISEVLDRAEVLQGQATCCPWPV
jgi:type I restriction enzyme S subunit